MPMLADAMVCLGGTERLNWCRTKGRSSSISRPQLMSKLSSSMSPAAGTNIGRFGGFLDMVDSNSKKPNVYEVYRLIDHSFVSISGSRHKSINCLVHREGCPKADSTWEPESNLTHSGVAKLVLTYRKIHASKVDHVTSVDHDYLATHERMQRHKRDIPFDKINACKPISLNSTL